MKQYWTEDSDGIPWYHGPSGKVRARGRWCVCLKCGNRFPAYSRNPGHYCSRSCWGKANGRPPKTRSGLFARWTPEECWLAGLIWADGCLHNDKSHFRVVLALVDEQAISLAAGIAGCQYYSYPQTPPRQTVHAIRIGDRRSIAHLMEHGLTERKSFTAEWPETPHPAAFLRGAFDGDGSVCQHFQGGTRRSPNAQLRLHSSLVGSPPFLEGAQTFLESHGIKQRKLVRHGRVWKLQWNHKDSSRLAEVLYADGGPCLERKRAVFMAWI